MIFSQRVFSFFTAATHCSNTIFFSVLQESIGGVARQYKQNRKANLREKYRVAQSLLDRLRRILEDVNIALRVIKMNSPSLQQSLFT